MMQSDYSPTLEDVLPEFHGGELTLKSNTIQQGQNRNISAVVHEIDLNKTKGNTLDNMEKDPTPTVTNLPVDGIKITEGYFSSREYFLQRAEKDCQSLVLHEKDVYVGGWLLTLVDHWDHEKERLVLLYEKSILIVKYDFIALTPVDCLRLSFEKLTKLTIGNLEYPKTSVAPRVQYIANQFTSVLGGLLNFTSSWKTTKSNYPNNSDDENRDSRRVRDGVRINFEPPHSAEPTWEKIWNPWSKDIPWLTFVSHPLLLKRKSDHKFDVQNFVSMLRDLLRDGIKEQTNAGELEQRERRFAEPIIQYQPIIMESYVGLSALVHNYSELGFFKARRGKVSF